MLAGAAFLNGLSFVILLVRLQDEPTGVPLTELFFATPFYWLVMLLAAPLITMRLFAQEKFSGTFETLMTAPVSDAAVVLGKYTAAWLFFMLLWAPVPAYMYALARIASSPELFSWPMVAGMLIGTGLLGAAFIGIGCWASALTRSQILAGMLGLALCVSLFLASFLGGRFASGTGVATQLFSYMNVVEYIQDCARGMLDTRLAVFALTVAGLFLALTTLAVGSRRWK